MGELVQQAEASQQLTESVRGEMKPAQAEMQEKGKRYGKSGGLFGGASLAGSVLQALVASVIATVALLLPVWAAALIVTAVLGAIAAVLARSPAVVVAGPVIGKSPPPGSVDRPGTAPGLRASVTRHHYSLYASSAGAPSPSR
ncbi:phage holin family protein [Streptomyces sp. NPDC086182]|uniref:phage holin family protein n=1 Tax=Streptomyces sp. NPDC086182 TaxID=3155058 RepID=UPI0034248B62